MQNAKLHIAPSLWMLIAGVLLVLTGCRRDLWVYTDDLYSVQLLTDWSEATEQPGGMTWWFIKEDGSGYSRHDKTGNVTNTMLNLPRGLYEGIVFDYSPEEYSHQEFIGMDYPSTALVHVLPSADQPNSGKELYGSLAVPDYMHGIPFSEGDSLYVLSAEPEIMNADTMRHQNIVTGLTEDHILWDERDKYVARIDTQVIHAKPIPIVWKLNVRVEVKGIQFMKSVRATIAGLTDGCWLVPMRHTSTPCLQLLDDWTKGMVNDSVGYIRDSVNTFGLPDPEMPASPIASRGGNVTREDGGATAIDYTKQLRLNLQFLLRDNKTYKNYHFDVSEEAIKIDDNQLSIHIDIPIDYPGPNLPEVDPEGSTGFDADVTPWADGGTADTTM